MRHYEIIIMVHPEQSNQIPSIIENCTNIINNEKGKIHRLEDWSRRQLAYSINRIHKAHFILMNIETSKKIIKELEDNFYFNSAIIRSIIIRTKYAVKSSSPMAVSKIKDNYDDRILKIDK